MSPELALMELETGKIISASFEEIPPITIPSITFHNLQAQWGMDILACSNNSKECHYWSKDTNQWTTFPALNSVHTGGSMSVVGGTPVVIAGRDENNNVHGIVNIFNVTTQKWIRGPSLMPIRTAHTTVVLNETTLLVIGGYDNFHLDAVNIFNLDELSWSDLNSLPQPTYRMLCGLVNITYLLCIGGEVPGQLVNEAYVLDLSISNPEWERKPSFDLEDPALGGFIYQIRDDLYCMTIFTSSYKPSMTLRRMNLNHATLTWENLEVFTNFVGNIVSPYVLNGFQIKP
ncbi:hypothetical protein TCAL_15471 [Tigriopus californicus]|uniref:Uncharacterized protein n=2 Tax=Tigriopus californicus TaxID=6832 RepID=A0A553PRJ7_TIGCA|nr:hypothetical protein TCAL_15471 [Tigriopus californicus]